MRAIDGARTRGLDLGKVARYQLRHYRTCRSLRHKDIIIFLLSRKVLFIVFYASVRNTPAESPKTRSVSTPSRTGYSITPTL